MNIFKDEIKQKSSMSKRQKNISIDSILSNVKKKKNTESICSLQGQSQDDQNSTILPETPNQKNYFLPLNQSKSKLYNNTSQENSIQRKIEKIKQQLQASVESKSNKNIVQQRLDQLEQTISEKRSHISQINDTSCKMKFSSTQNGFNFNILTKSLKNSTHMRNLSDKTSTHRGSNLKQDSILTSSPTSSQYNFKLNRSKKMSFQEDQIVGDYMEGHSAFFEQIQQKKKQEFCEVFYENLQKDAERQYKSIPDRSKPINQLHEQHCEKTIKVTEEIVEILGQAINLSKNSSQLDEKLNLSINKATQLKISYLMLLLQKLFGKICYEYNDYLKSIKFMKLCKNFAQYFNILKFKISCYKYIGLSFQRLNKPKVSLQFFIKMLRQSWFIKEDDYELNAYDLIGMSYFYLGNIEEALQFHQMLIDGIRGEEKVKKISNAMLNNRIFSNYPTLQSLRIKQDQDGDQQSNNKAIKKSKIINNQYQLNQQEWNEYISSSEDEFELPQSQIGQKNLSQKNFQIKMFNNPWNDRFIKTQIHKLELVQETSYNKNPIGLIFKSSEAPIEKSSGPKPQLVIGPNASHMYNHSLQTTYSSRLRVSHKTPNREFFNYHAQLQQKINETNLINQQSSMSDPLELSHFIKVVKRIKKMREYLKSLIPFLNQKLQDLQNQNPNQNKDQFFLIKDLHKQNTISPQLIFTPSHMNASMSSFTIEDPLKLTISQPIIKQPSEKSQYFESRQQTQRKNIFTQIYKPYNSISQQETKKQSPENKTNPSTQKKILQLLLNDKNNVVLQKINKQNNSNNKQELNKSKSKYFKTSRADNSFSSSLNFFQKDFSTPRNQQNLIQSNHSRKSSQQIEISNL